MHLKSPYPDPPLVPDTNVHNVILRRPDQAEWPDFTMYIDGISGRKRKFKEFMQRIHNTMTGIASPATKGGLGLVAPADGTMVGIISENMMDYPVLVHALLALCVPFALISSFSTRFELSHSVNLSKATHLFVHPRLLSLVTPVAKKAGIPSKNIFIISGHSSGYRSLTDIIDRGQKLAQVPVQEASKDTLAYLVFSSGTSGLPKAVMISHGNLIYSLLQAGIIGQVVAEVFQPPPSPTPEGIPCGLAYLPMHHSYGLHAYCLRACLTPATFVVIPRWNIELALKLIPRYKVTVLTLIPSVVHQLVNYPAIRKADLSSVQAMNNGAAYLPPELANKLSRLVPGEVIMSEGYGMSEGTIASISRPFPGVMGGRLKSVPGSTGVLLPGMEGRLLRDDGSEVEIDEVGELYVKGGNVALGYWRNDQATKETFTDGWLRTGDRFRVNKEGYFFFADRAKDTLKVSGSQVSPVEIEDVLLSHPRKLISDATVAGVSGGRTSDEKVPRAWVVLTPAGKQVGSAAVIKELESWHQENLSKYKWLRGGIEVVKEIPKSPTGKTLRRVLQERYERRLKKARSKL